MTHDKAVLGSGPKLYAGKSVFTYTFGSAAWATGSECKIKDSSFAASSSVVSSCVASGTTIVIKMGTAATSAAFGVEIYGSTASWAQTA